MATRHHDREKLSHNREVLVTWANLAPGDVGEPFEPLGFSDRAVEFMGDFGAGGCAVLEGSLTGARWFTLNDPFNAALSFSVEGLRQVLEPVRYLRPRITGGDGTTDITCALLAKG